MPPLKYDDPDPNPLVEFDETTTDDELPEVDEGDEGLPDEEDEEGNA
jgi:hypothetical protein